MGVKVVALPPREHAHTGQFSVLSSQFSVTGQSLLKRRARTVYGAVVEAAAAGAAAWGKMCTLSPIPVRAALMTG